MSDGPILTKMNCIYTQNWIFPAAYKNVLVRLEESKTCGGLLLFLSGPEQSIFGPFI